MEQCHRLKGPLTLTADRSTQWKTGSRAWPWTHTRKVTGILMSNSSQSPGEKPSSEVTTTPSDDDESVVRPTVSFDDDIPQATQFPIITIVLALDDPSEPNHVDLGSVPPQIAAAVFRTMATQLEKLSWPSRVTYAGQTVFEPVSYTHLTLPTILRV